jgi:tetratricopeptide (TPR) repeat protein
VAAGVLWFAVAVLPVSNLLFPVGVMMAERALYLPSVGLAFLAVPLVAALRREGGARAARVAPAAGAVLLALAAARTWTRTPVWASSDALFQSMMREHPSLWWVEWRAGQILVRAGRAPQALPWYRSAITRVGGNQYVMALDYADVLLDLGRGAEAEPLLRHAVATYPGSVPAYTSLASVLIDAGRYREAGAVLDRAAAIPRYGALSAGEILHRRALAYDGLGAVDSALAARRASLRDPQNRAHVPAWVHYGRLLAERGDTAAAAAALDSARNRLAPALRPLVRLHPLPSLRDRLVKGWGPLPADPPAPARP